jgi:hypothetical protein
LKLNSKMPKTRVMNINFIIEQTSIRRFLQQNSLQLIQMNLCKSKSLYYIKILVQYRLVEDSQVTKT